jgi:hypothetical protein
MMVCGAIEVIVAHSVDAVYVPAVLIAVAGPPTFLAGDVPFRSTPG